MSLSSSETFIRALRAPNDPPQTGGPLKIQLADEAWRLHSFYVPSKAELLAEWILSRLLKDREREGALNPILDVRYWKLLADILHNAPSSADLTTTAITKTSASANLLWLPPHINRIPTFPILSTLIKQISTATTPVSSEVTKQAVRCFTVILPLARPKASFDAVFECFGETVKALAHVIDHRTDADTDANAMDVDEDEARPQRGNLDESQVLLAKFAVDTFRSAHAESPAPSKKKTYAAFVQTYLPSFIRVCSTYSNSSNSQRVDLSTLLASVCEAGDEVIFAPDILRFHIPPSPSVAVTIDPKNIASASTSTAPLSILTHLETLASVPNSSDSQTQLLQALPHFMRTFVAVVRKHRSVLFADTAAGSSSSVAPKTRVKDASMKFFEGCLALADIASVHENDTLVELRKWEARIGLLGVLESESLFASSDLVGRQLLDGLVGRAEGVLRLARAKNESSFALVSVAIRVLTTLIQLDYDLVGPHVPDILGSIASCPSSVSAHALDFLSHHLSYHSKTRTLDVLILDLKKALLPSLLPSASDVYEYATISRSPLLSHAYTSTLRTALLTYLTPSQVLGVVSSLLGTLGASWTTHQAQIQQGLTSDSDKKRKRKSVATEPERGSEISSAPTKIALVSRLASTTLSALPVRTLSSEVLEEVKSVVQRFREEILDRVGPLVLDITKSGHDHGIELVGAALLRLGHDLQGTIFCLLRGDARMVLDDEDGRRIAVAIRDQGLLPELVVELARTALQKLAVMHSSHSPSASISNSGPVVLDAILDRMNVNVLNSSWQGSYSELSYGQDGMQKACITLWHVVMDRWLPAIDQYASIEQRDRLVGLILQHYGSAGTDEGTKGTRGLTVRMVIQRTFRSAEFWELGNIRTSVLAALDRKTGVFGPIDMAQCLNSLYPSLDSTPPSRLTVNATEAQISEALDALGIILFLPTEYFAKSSRTELVRRALVADVYIAATYSVSGIDTRSPKKKSKRKSTGEGNKTDLKSDTSRMVTEPAVNGIEWRTMLRTFVLRVARETAVNDILVSDANLLVYLASPIYTPVNPSAAFANATIDLLEDSFNASIKFALRDAAGVSAVAAVLKHYLASQPFADVTDGQRLDQQSLLVFLRTVSDQLDFTKVPPAWTNSLQELSNHVGSSIRPLVQHASDGKIPFSASTHFLVEAWRIHLKTRRWMNQHDHEGAALGIKLFAPTFAWIRGSPVPSPHCAAVLSLLAEEAVTLQGATRVQHIQTMVASFAVFYTALDKTHDSTLDASMIRVLKTFTLEDYTLALGLIQEVLEGRNEKELVTMIHLSDLLMKHSPDGSYKAVQEHGTRCLQALNHTSYPDEESRVRTLTFVLNQCSERSLSLRTLDIGFVLVILARSLSGSSTHAAQTSYQEYTLLVSIATALVRLRRDLVAAALPHLSTILSSLILGLRSVRPELGARQKRTITNTLPYWINSEEPLGVNEAKAFARLLTSLTTKSIVRPGIAHADVTQQKAQSLSQPFSKHAPYVLTAYLRALSDPLSMFSLPVRRELEPGLFALCEMMGEHGRDAIMAALLDSGGKLMMKLLWKEYEKQRYTGQG